VFERSTVETVYGAVAAFTAGPAPPSILYLHSEPAVSPDPAAIELARSVGVVVPTHPGFADAPRPDWVETVRDVADVYSEAMLQLFSAGPITVVGASLGGWIATELALLRPEWVVSLVLIGPAGLCIPDAPPRDHWFTTDQGRASMLFRDVANAPSVEAAEFIANDETTARYAWNPRFSDPSLNDRIRRLRVPVTVLWGADDRLFPVEQSSAWLALLPAARLVVVPDCGHFPAYECPDAVVSAVLSAVPASATSSVVTAR
jgi:pimeloyl-ACP methyl ester carboxylesterase